MRATAGVRASTPAGEQVPILAFWAPSCLCLFFFLNDFIYLFLAWSSLLCGLFSSCGEQGLISSCNAQASHCSSFSCGVQTLGTWAQNLRLPGSTAQAQQLRCTGWAALRHVGSSWTRNRTCVCCTGRWILYHWATKAICLCLKEWTKVVEIAGAKSTDTPPSPLHALASSSSLHVYLPSSKQVRLQT